MVGGETGAHAPVHERTSDPREARSRTPFYVALVLIYSVLAVLLVFTWPAMFGFNTYTGLGTSMGDAIPSGSLLVTRSVDPADIEVGDVISFRYPGVENPITHRVIAIRERNGSFAFATQGDANHAPDPFVVSGDPEIERLIYSKPYLGLALPFAKALLLSGTLAGLSFLWIARRRARLARELRARDTFGIALDGR